MYSSVYGFEMANCLVLLLLSGEAPINDSIRLSGSVRHHATIIKNQKTNKQKLYDRKRCITCMAVFYSVGTNVLKKDFRRRKEKEIN